MTATQAERICSTCNNVLPIDGNNTQSGAYCCDEYFCNEQCLNKSFEQYQEGWNEHYTEDGDCYFTEWDKGE